LSLLLNATIALSRNFCALTVGCWFQTWKNNQGRATNCRISVWHRSMECVDSWCSGTTSACEL